MTANVEFGWLAALAGTKGAAVTPCGSATEALSCCRSGVCQFDVVLAEARLVAMDEATGRAFIESFEETPVVLMSECSTTGDVLRAVKLGAVDWLDKPLSLLKLKNIWQHSVRRMMQRTSFYDAGADKAPAPLTQQVSAGVPLELCSLRSKPRTGSVGLDSPTTPTIGDSHELDAISVASLGSIRDLTDFSMGDAMARASFDSCDGSQDGFGSACGAPRPPLATKPSSFGPLVPVPPPSHWPQLQPGCVWGTPVGGLLAPPPLPAQAPVPPAPCPAGFVPSVPSTSHMSLSSSGDEDTVVTLTPSSIATAGATNSVCIPHGFLDGDDARSERGPIGLKLRKSGSLLNLINAALSASM
ncbi:hypothetical protein N2152v2_005090 [Parachlorella kessleri]